MRAYSSAMPSGSGIYLALAPEGVGVAVAASGRAMAAAHPEVAAEAH